jgi:hypothetical protein
MHAHNPSPAVQANPRRLRDEHRGQLAARQARDAGAGAVDAAIARINATFGPAWDANYLKLSCESIIRMGADHPAVRARYTGRAEASGAGTLAEAIAVVEVWRAAELRRPKPSRLSLQVLAELRLLLRLMRRRGLAWAFPLVMSALLGERVATMRAA